MKIMKGFWSSYFPEMLEVSSHCFYCATWISGRLTFYIHYSMPLVVFLLGITNLKAAPCFLDLNTCGFMKRHRIIRRKFVILFHRLPCLSWKVSFTNEKNIFSSSLNSRNAQSTLLHSSIQRVKLNLTENPQMIFQKWFFQRNSQPESWPKDLIPLKRS